MPIQRNAAGKQGRAELIKKVIKRLITSPQELAEAIGALQTGDIESALDAGQRAIETLKSPRCDRLRADEVAVAIDRGKRQTDGLLANPFRPDHPDGYMLVKLKKNEDEGAGEASLRGGIRKPYFVYRRKPIMDWWETYLDKKSSDAADKAKASRRTSLERKLATIQRQLALLNFERSQFAFLVDEHDQIVDNLALPIHDAPEIASHLEAGGRIEHITLTEALTVRTWTAEGAYEPWWWVWLSRIEEEKGRLEALVFAAREKHADGRANVLAGLGDARASESDPGRMRSRS